MYKRNFFYFCRNNFVFFCLDHVRNCAESVLVFVMNAAMRFADEIIQSCLRLAHTEGVDVGTGDDVRMEFGHLGPVTVPNELVIPVPAQRFDDVQPRLAANYRRARSRRPGGQRRRPGGRAHLVAAAAADRWFTGAEVVDDLLVQMVIAFATTSRPHVTFRLHWRWLRSRQLPPASSSHSRRSCRRRSSRLPSSSHSAGLRGHYRRCHHLRLGLLLLLLALEIFDDFQHASSHSGESGGAVLVRLLFCFSGWNWTIEIKDDYRAVQKNKIKTNYHR